MADVFEVAERALTIGWVPVPRASFQPGQPQTLAVDVSGDFAAVRVVELNDARGWALDIVRCEMVDGLWNTRGSGGGTYGDLPLENDPDDPTGLAVESHSGGESDSHRHWAAGGFVLGDVRAVELSVGALTRRVEIGPHPTAFVVGISDLVDDDAEGDEPDAVPVVRALDGAGQVVDESRPPWRPGPPEGALTVAEALQQPDGTTVDVHGTLLSLAGQPAMLCDEIDASARPPRPIGPALSLPGTDFEPSWTPDNGGWVHTLMVTATGIVSEGALLDPPEPPTL